MEPIDVKNIHDIPEIELMLNWEFKFKAYEKGDNTLMYEYKQKYNIISVEIISDEPSFFDKEKFSDLITQKNLGFFQITKRSKDEYPSKDSIIYSYMYRPFIEDSEKNYN